MADYVSQDGGQATPEEPKKLSLFERSKLWKADKKSMREAEKAKYQHAPLPTRIWNLYLKKPVTVLAILGLLAYIFAPAAKEYFENMVSTGINAVYDTRNNPVDKEKIYELAPLDKEGAKRIDALGSVDADDTWTICVYMVGSNLEDSGENDLSQVTRMQVQQQLAQGILPEETSFSETLPTYMSELEANGLALPDYLYYPIKPSGEAPSPANPNYVSTRLGAASADMDEMTSDVWSDKINIVIQTGGATHWSNQLVNPNRTQRLLYKDGVLKVVEDLPLRPSSITSTLADYLKFCRENYPADHTMLVLWNHGGGAFGYGNDTIYGSELSLKDIREALSSVYEPNQADPAFDIISFDACLMSSLEVTHALNGFASYYAVSEEVEPGDGWDYGPWLKALSDDPTMHPAQVARAVADSYMDYYMTQNVNLGFLLQQDVTFSVLDAAKAEELYAAYGELAKAQLADATTDLSVLADIGRCADRSTHYSGSASDIYNTIDLGNYVNYMGDFYPEQCSKIKDLIGETVLYHRESGSLAASEGITIYLPGTIHDAIGFSCALKYINQITDDEATKALYYYKIAGTLNDELKQYARTLSDVEPKKLDTQPFKDFGNTMPELKGDYFSISLDKTLEEMLQSSLLEFARFDEESGNVVYYGKDDYLSYEGDGTLNVDFDGEWVYLDKLPLAIEVVSSNDSFVTYRSKVSVNNEKKYLEFIFDRDTEELTIIGARDVPTSMYGGDALTVNVFANTKTLNELPEGAEISPIYTFYNRETQVMSEEESKESVVFEKGLKLALRGLDDGYYLGTAVITDIRGDEYYSPVMGYNVSGGKITNRMVDENFRGSSW